VDQRPENPGVGGSIPALPTIFSNNFPPGNGAGVSDGQLDAIAKIERAKGLDVPTVDALSLRVFNRKPGQLAQREAAELIKQLSNMKRSAV